MVEVVVKLAAPEDASRTRPHSPLNLANDLGLKLVQVHPGVDERGSALLYHGYIRDPDARSIAARLRESEGVVAAYVKPAAELP